MIKQLVSLVLVLLLLTTVCGNSAFAKTVSDADSDSSENKTTTRPVDNRSNERLRSNILKLVADTKDRKVVPTVEPQAQPQNKNHLSKGTKVAIAVGVIVAVIAIIVVAKADKGPTGPIGVF